MLDLKFVRSNPEVVREALKKRGFDFDLDGFIRLDQEYRSLLHQTEELRSRRNSLSTQIGRAKKDGEDAGPLLEEMKEINSQLKEAEDRLSILKGEMEAYVLSIPNIPHESVPVGKDDTENVVVKRWGDIEENPLRLFHIGTLVRSLEYSTLRGRQR